MRITQMLMAAVGLDEVQMVDASIEYKLIVCSFSCVVGLLYSVVHLRFNLLIGVSTLALALARSCSCSLSVVVRVLTRSLHSF